MENSSTSEKIQTSFDQKIRLNDEKANLVKSIREKYKGLADREKRAKELTGKLFEPIVTPLKSLAKDKTNTNTVLSTTTPSIKSEIVKTENKIKTKKEPLDDNDASDDSSNSIDEDEEISVPTSTHGLNLQESVEKIIGTRSKRPILGFNVEVNKTNGDIILSTRKKHYPITIDYDRNVILVNSREYPLTKHLAELLFTGKISKLNPDYREIDTYNQILTDVGDYPLLPPSEKKERNKYYRFIRKPTSNPVLITKRIKKNKKHSTASDPSYKYGGGPNVNNLDLKVFSRKNQDVKYIYWNSPSKLIHRLCLLISTKQAGNTNPQIDEEIESIETQLREADIIE